MEKVGKAGKYENILIVSDLDDTFLSFERAVVERNLRAIEAFEKEGGRFTFSSGRNHQTILNAVPMAAQIANAPGGMVNGAYLYDFRKQESMLPVYMEKETALQVARFVHTWDPALGIRISTKDGIGVAVSNAYIQQEFVPDILGSSYYWLPPETWMGEEWYKIVVRGEPDLLDRLRVACEKEFGPCYEYVKSSGTYFEIQTKCCTKARVIACLREYYALRGSVPKIYACGDYENDLPMLMAADVAVCPSNAHEDVKKVADLCLCSCSDGVIADLIEKL